MNRLTSTLCNSKQLRAHSKLFKSLGSTLNQDKRHYSSAIPADYQVSTLSNGIRVATDFSPSHFAAMGLYLHAGSRFENDHLRGVSHIVDRLAFKSTAKRSALDMEEQLAALGGNYMCASSRETMMYQASVFHDDLEKMFELVAETVVEPEITQQEVYEQLDTAQYEIYEIWQKPELILPELGHMVAFKGGLGNPLLCPQDRLDSITPALINEYRKTFYRPERLVAAFVGVSHEKAVELAEKYLGHMKKPSTPNDNTLPPSVYTGGEITIPSQPSVPNFPEFYHLHILFEGLSINDEDVYALATLQTLLGGGGSFSAGGPGKGMYSRLYTDVLNRFGYIESCLSINHSYSDSGLFGISASSLPNAAPYMADIICQQLGLTFTKGIGALNYTEVQRAKNQLKSSLLMNLESKMVELEDLGRQIQLNDKKVSVIEMCEKIQALTPDDLRRVSEKVLRGSAPTFVMQGSRAEFGDVEAVVKRHGLGV